MLACSSSWTCHLEGKDSNYFLSSFSSYNFPSFQAYYTFHVSKFGNDVLYETILKFWYFFKIKKYIKNINKLIHLWYRLLGLLILWFYGSLLTLLISLPRIRLAFWAYLMALCLSLNETICEQHLYLCELSFTKTLSLFGCEPNTLWYIWLG